jgi:hypothetical protein
MARLLRYVEKMLMRFPAGTFARIDAVLTPLEDRADFVRGLVERELRRRERGVADPLAKHLAPRTARERAVRGAGRAA